MKSLLLAAVFFLLAISASANAQGVLGADPSAAKRTPRPVPTPWPTDPECCTKFRLQDALQRREFQLRELDRTKREIRDLEQQLKREQLGR